MISAEAPRSGGRGFADRLSPLERWVDRQVGRGWSNIYRDFCQRFDRRTLKGWHLNDHLLSMVGQGRFPSWASFWVDTRGILRRQPPRAWKRRSLVSSPDDRARALDWAAGRRVVVRGEVVFWTARVVDSLVPTSAQGRRLTAAESDFWSSLAPELRQMLTYNPKAIPRRPAAGTVLGTAPE